MCTHPRTAALAVEKSASSGRAALQHTENSVYRCYLPVLTEFTGFCCTGPSLHHHLTNGRPKQALPSGGSSTPVERIPGYRAPLTPHLAHRTLNLRDVGCPLPTFFALTCVCQAGAPDSTCFLYTIGKDCGQVAFGIDMKIEAPPSTPRQAQDYASSV